MTGDLETDLMLIEVGGDRFGIDVRQIVRIENDGDVPQSANVSDRPSTKRALLFRREADGALRRVTIDVMGGTHRVRSSSLRRIPPTVVCAGFVIGLWLLNDEIVLLIDLETLSHLLDSRSSDGH